MVHAFLLSGYLALFSMSAVSAMCGNWQPAIWILFLLSVLQNTISQFKVLDRQ